MSDYTNRITLNDFASDIDPAHRAAPRAPGVQAQVVDGGLVKHSTYQPRQEAMQAPAAPELRAEGTSYAADSAGNITQRGRIQYAVTFDGVHGGGVADTLRRDGSKQSVELIPGLPASRTDIGVALKQRLIEPDGFGGYRDTEQRAERVQALDNEVSGVEESETPSAADPAFDAQDLDDWSHDIAPLAQAAYDATAARAIAAVVAGEGLEAAARELARMQGIDPALAQQYVDGGFGMYQRAAEKALGKVGIVGDDLHTFYAWARQQEPMYLRHAIQRLTTEHHSGEFGKLGMTWQNQRMRRG